MQHEPSHEAESHLRLLVIDDDLIQRVVISKIGVQAGFVVVAASSLEDASQCLHNERFDCITLDLSLGDKSGVTLLKTIADGANRVPVIVISGADEHVLNATLAMGHSLGLDTKTFPKPLNLIELRKTLGEKQKNAGVRRALNTLLHGEAVPA